MKKEDRKRLSDWYFEACILPRFEKIEKWALEKHEEYFKKKEGLREGYIRRA